MPASQFKRWALYILLALGSGALWLLVWQGSQLMLASTNVGPGITLINLPAGLRLLLLLITDIWGALGIALIFPFALLQVFPHATIPAIISCSVAYSFVPYMAIAAICRAIGAASTLSNLRPIHLPILAAAASVTAAFAGTTVLTLFGLFPAGTFLADFSSWALGDFLGSFAVVLICLTITKLAR